MALELERKLDGVRRRVRALSGVYGLGRVVAAVVGGVSALVVADYVLDLYAWPRVVIGVVGLVGALWLVWRELIRPATRRLSLSDVAGRVEETYPQLEDRLRSAVAFGGGGGGAGGGGGGGESSAMRERVRVEAEGMVGGLDLTRVVAARPAVRWAMIGVGAVVVVMGVSVALPGAYRSAAISRLVDPFGGTRWPKRTEIALVGEVPRRVPAGERVSVRARLPRGDKPSARATVYYQYDNGVVRSEVMTRSGDGVYSSSLDARAGSDEVSASELKVWIKAGDDEVRLVPVTVVPRLALRRVTAEVLPPAYAREGKTGAGGAGSSAEWGGAYDLAQGPATVVEGSRVRLKMDFNKALAGTPELVWVDSLQAGGAGAAAPRRPEVRAVGAAAEKASSAAVEFGAESTVRFRVAGRDGDGFSTASLVEYEVTVRPDQAPSIQIDIPRRSEERTAVAVVPVEATAEDDFRVAEVAMSVRRLGDGREWVLPLVAAGAAVGEAVSWSEGSSAADRTRMRLRHLWDLAALKDADLKPGDVLEFYLAARDNYRRVGADGVALVHPPATSSRLRITIVSQDDAASRAAEELRAAAEQIGQLRLAQQRTGNETTELAEESARTEKLDEARKGQAKRLGEQQSVLAGQTKQVSGKIAELMNRMAENRLESKSLPETARDVRDLLDRAAEGPMKEAASRVGDSREAGKAERGEKLAKAQGEQRESEKLLGQAVDRLGSLGSMRQTMDELRKLLEAQREVGKETRELGRNTVGRRPEELAAEDRKKLEELAKKQAELSKQTEKLIGQMDKQAQELSKSDPQGSESLKQAGETGKQQQVAPSQQKASSNLQQNQQQQAQAEQKRAEVGLQVMLEKMREAERKKLEELTRKLADLQDQLRVLVRRQAGHNLDNMGMRDGVLAKLGAKVREELIGLAERTKEKPAQWAAGADGGGLSAGQELTERNTRSLSDGASELQGGAEAAGALSRAAGRMERAAVLIRQKDLWAAYEPPQVDALAALVEAARTVDELKKKAEAEKADQQRETIRAIYVAIRGEQDALMRETGRIEAVRRRAGDAAELPRVEVQKLSVLPGQQGGLAKRTEAIDPDLAALGSVVYVWANKDIAETMNAVKGMLERRETGAAVSGEQARVIEQLDAMIASLSVSPAEKEFDERGGGGGGGGGGAGEQKQKLPSEAELQLLKRMQLAVNKGTREQAKVAGATAKEVLTGLARRQGEFRRLAGQMLEEASRGEFKLGPELERTVKLPEEIAGDNKAADEQLDNELLGGPAHGEGAEPSATRVVDRMGRVRQRLGDDSDPGAITQAIQDRIVKDLDELIDKARQQQSQSSSSQASSKGSGQGKPEGNRPGGEQANNQGQSQGQNSSASGQSQTGATVEAGGNGSAVNPQGGDIRGKAAEWGALAPRQRQAVIEGQGDVPVEKYRRLIDDYYRSLAERSSGSGGGSGGGGAGSAPRSGSGGR